MALLSEIVSYTNRFLRIRDVGDWDNDKSSDWGGLSRQRDVPICPLCPTVSPVVATQYTKGNTVT